MKLSFHPFAFCLYPFRSHPFPLHPSAVNNTCLDDLLKNFLRFRVGEAKLDGNANPTFNGFVTVARRDKSPPLDRFSGGSVQRFAAGAAVDLHMFRSTLIVDQNAQNYSALHGLRFERSPGKPVWAFRYSALESKRRHSPMNPDRCRVPHRCQMIRIHSRRFRSHPCRSHCRHRPLKEFLPRRRPRQILTVQKRAQRCCFRLNLLALRRIEVAALGCRSGLIERDFEGRALRSPGALAPALSKHDFRYRRLARGAGRLVLYRQNHHPNKLGLFRGLQTKPDRPAQARAKSQIQKERGRSHRSPMQWPQGEQGKNETPFSLLRRGR